MDQGRLEELKKLLNERRGDAKQNCSNELGVENSKTENFESLNSEIQNSEVSNFEARNSEVPNSEASNSETLNSDPGALNLKTETDQNSACENSAKQQNFTSNDSGSLWQNSKVRDYDKYPLVIKDHTY